MLPIQGISEAGIIPLPPSWHTSSVIMASVSPASANGVEYTQVEGRRDDRLSTIKMITEIKFMYKPYQNYAALSIYTQNFNLSRDPTASLLHQTRKLNAPCQNKSV